MPDQISEDDCTIMKHKIIIKNPTSETVIHNVDTEDLPFWENLIQGHVRGTIAVEPA